MSINHYSCLDLPETTLWWTQQQHQQQPTWFINSPHTNTLQEDSLSKHPTNTPQYFNLNQQNHHQQQQEEDDEEEKDNNSSQLDQDEIKEPMFEKPLTPSDVGKLNRLVIPKQHAEKYFPLGAANNNVNGSGDSGECKGLLLSFEDESGKCWRFRYSYWNSSQSYVLTKGWSRYVKDKRLDAGDVVLFQRHSEDAQRLFIRWRRRRGSEVAHVSRGFYSAHPYPTHHQNLPANYNCQHHDDALYAGGGGSQGLNRRTRPLGNSCSCSSSSSRVLRLFGVNMEYQLEHDSGPSTLPQCSSYTTMPSTHPTNTLHQPSYSSNPPHQPYYY